MKWNSYKYRKWVKRYIMIFILLFILFLSKDKLKVNAEEGKIDWNEMIITKWEEKEEHVKTTIEEGKLKVTIDTMGMKEKYYYFVMNTYYKSAIAYTEDGNISFTIKNESEDDIGLGISFIDVDGKQANLEKGSYAVINENENNMLLSEVNDMFFIYKNMNGNLVILPNQYDKTLPNINGYLFSFLLKTGKKYTFIVENIAVDKKHNYAYEKESLVFNSIKFNDKPKRFSDTTPNYDKTLIEIDKMDIFLWVRCSLVGTLILIGISYFYRMQKEKSNFIKKEEEL